MNVSAEYILGHSDLELDRLQLQSAIIGGVTARLIGASGIGPGWSVLEVGCGAGDVTVLLAEAVGPCGKVLAFDREPKAVGATRAKVSGAGFSNVKCVAADALHFPEDEPFDAVFGRYVLVHQPDPVRMLRDAAALVKPGGIIAFHEISFDPRAGFGTTPKVESFESLGVAVADVFRARLPSPDVADRFVQIFDQAGLPPPSLLWECVAGNWQAPIVRWMVLSALSMKDHIAALGLRAQPFDEPEALVAKIRSDLKSVNAQVVSRAQVCAWSVRDDSFDKIVA